MKQHHEEEILGKAYDARLMKRLLAYLRPYKPLVALSFLAILLHSGLQAVGPFLTKVAIDRYLAATARQPTFLDAWLSPHAAAGLAQVAALYLLTLLVSFAVDFLQTYSMQLAGQKVMFDLRMQIFGHLQKLHAGFFDRNPVGRLVTRLTTDVDALNEMFSSGVIAVFGDFFTLAAIVGVMVSFHAPLALVSFSVLPLIVLATALFRRRVRDSYRRIRTAIARINAYLQEHITGMAVVQLFNREQKSFEEFDDVNRRHMRAFKDSVFAHSLFYPTIEVLSATAIALILWYGGLRVMGGTLTLGVVVAFIQYAQRFYRPIQDLSEKYNILQGAMASSERIFKLLDTPPEIVSPAAPARLESPRGRIEFRDVWFAYKNGAEPEWVLKDVSFTIEPDETIAIVGHTGAGKTTMMNLLLRFYDPQRGQILLDGVDLRDADLKELRRMFGVVLQDPFLFSGTVERNIRLGSDHLERADLEEAAEEVNLADFIRALPGGFDEEVRERGATLSTGQKQLISFARALAHRPRILVLDEATSSVDTRTEIEIQQALLGLMKGRTSFVIAHRLSTIRNADLVLVINDGQIIERGTHASLLAERGFYHRLYMSQFRRGEGEVQPASVPAE